MPSVHTIEMIQIIAAFLAVCVGAMSLGGSALALGIDDFTHRLLLRISEVCVVVLVLDMLSLIVPYCF